MKKTFLIFVLGMYFLPYFAWAGMLDDFEGGVNWGDAPWSANSPLWNKNGSTDPDEILENNVLETMNPEWYQYSGDFNGGPDYGYIEHDYSHGADGTCKSLKYVITGGNIKASQPPEAYGSGAIANIEAWKRKQEFLSDASKIADVPGSGNFYLYFGSSGGSPTTGLHNRFVVPLSKRPPGSNRMSFWILNPSFGDNLNKNANVSIGTRVNSESRFDSGNHAGMHYYHNAKIAKSNYWQKIVITPNPDHRVSCGGYCDTPNDETWTTGLDGFKWHYMEGLSHFYVEGGGVHNTPTPWKVWMDQFDIWQENRIEDVDYIATRTAAYLGNNQMLLNWTGRWNATDASKADPYNIYYSTIPLNQDNFSAIGTLVPGGPFKRVETAYVKNVQAIFTIPNFDENAVYYFAISAVGSDKAGFIDYRSGHDAINLSCSTGMPNILPVLPKRYVLADFLALVADWLQSITSSSDLNNDGVVNAKDLGVLMANW